MDASSAEVEKALEKVERLLGVAFPEDYRRFLTEEGAVNRSFPPVDDFLQIHPVSELVDLNEAAELADRLPGAVIIGGDGSRELLIYDCRQQPPALFLADITAEDWSDALHQASSLTEFLAQFPEQGWLWE